MAFATPFRARHGMMLVHSDPHEYINTLYRESDWR